jgi:hypothetical protein
LSYVVAELVIESFTQGTADAPGQGVRHLQVIDCTPALGSRPSGGTTFRAGVTQAKCFLGPFPPERKTMLKRLIPIFALLSLMLPISLAWADDDYQETINVFKNAGESANFFKTAYGYAVFPTIGKGGVGVGGAFGKGRVYAKGKYVGDASMSQVTVGFQLGGQAYSQIVFFQDQRAFKQFTSGNFAFGAEASAVAITAAAGAKANTAGS